MAAQNLPKTVFQSIKNNIAQTTQEVIKDSAATAAEQIGVGTSQEQSQQPQSQFDTESYRHQLEQEERKKMAELRNRLAQIQSEVDAARSVRTQSVQEYNQSQDQLLHQDHQEKMEEEQRKQQEVQLPQSVRSKQGTSESGRRNRKG